MYEYDDICIQTFLEKQRQLFPEEVAESPEEALDFLDMVMAGVCENVKEVRKYLDDAGADLTGMSNEDVLEAEEVFALPDGRYLVVLA